MTDQPIDLEAIKRDHDVACDYHQLRMTISHRQRGQLIAEVERLRARVEELERDAARYDFLREIGLSFCDKLDLQGDNADAAIDAAMSEGNNNGSG